MTEKKKRIPPDRNKYSFGDFSLGEIKVIEGNYTKIRYAAYSYGRKHNKMFLVKRNNCGVKVERFK